MSNTSLIATLIEIRRLAASKRPITYMGNCAPRANCFRRRVKHRAAAANRPRLAGSKRAVLARRRRDGAAEFLGAGYGEDGHKWRRQAGD
jgi:hypothetical protein